MRAREPEGLARRGTGAELKKPPLKDELETLAQLMDQDLEPDPGGGGEKIREGVAADRRVSVEDREMRHGRKSKTKRFNGYKRHIATDLDSGLILAGAITPANRPEDEAAPVLQRDIAAGAARSPSCTSTAATSRARSSTKCSAAAATSSASLGSRGTASPSPRPTSRSTCATSPSPARPARSSASSSARWWSSTRRPATTAGCGPSARPPAPGTGRTVDHRRGRTASAPAAQAPDHPLRPSPAARARRHRAPARAPRPPAGTPRSLPRHAQEPLRPTPRLGHPEPRDHPAQGRVMRSLSNRSVF